MLVASHVCGAHTHSHVKPIRLRPSDGKDARGGCGSQADGQLGVCRCPEQQESAAYCGWQQPLPLEHVKLELVAQQATILNDVCQLAAPLNDGGSGRRPADGLPNGWVRVVRGQLDVGDDERMD